MPIIGLNYTKISANRSGDSNQKLDINTVPEITDFKQATLESFGGKVNVARVNFAYKTIIEPNIGNITIEGIIIYENENIKDISEQWKTEKKLPVDAQLEIINYIFRTVSIKALIISEILQLPPVINLPVVKDTKKKETKKEAKSKK